MDVLDAIKTRRSVRSYSERAIPDDVMSRMKLALRYAPSACNYQPWHFILVTDAQLRRKVAHASNDQLWLSDAPVLVVAMSFHQQAYTHMGGYGNSGDLDVAIALDHLTLAAVAEGLGTCWIGAFDEAAVARLLKTPSNAKIVALTPLGYPATPDLNFPLDDAQRKSESEIFSTDYFGNA